MSYVDTEFQKKIARETIVKDIVVAMINKGFMNDLEKDKNAKAIGKAYDGIRKHIKFG